MCCASLRSLTRSGVSLSSHSKSNRDNRAAGSWIFCSMLFFILYRPVVYDGEVCEKKNYQNVRENGLEVPSIYRIK